jgi:hypothetical protein
VQEDPAAVAAREQVKVETGEKLKWVFAAGLVAFVGFVVWQFAAESAVSARRANRKREPWEDL